MDYLIYKCCKFSSFHNLVSFLILKKFISIPVILNENFAFFRSLRSNQIDELEYGVFGNDGNMTHL